MLTLEQIKEKIKDRRPGVICKACNISRQTLYNLMTGKSEPSYSVVKALSDYLEKQ